MKKGLLQSGAHPSVHVAEVLSNLGKACAVHRFGLTLGTALDLHRAKVWSNLNKERPILIVGRQVQSGVLRQSNGTQEMYDQHLLLANCSRSFLCACTE